MKATFVSVWDGGTEIRTSCQFNPDTNDVTDIELADGTGLDIFDEQYVELSDGTKVFYFTIEGEPNQDDNGLTSDEINFLRNIVDKHLPSSDQD